MKNPSIAKKILSAWEINRANSGKFMCVYDIACAVYGREVFQHKSKNFHDAHSQLLESIRNNIPHAINLANENGMMIAIRRRPTANNKDIKVKIIGWRIFVPNNDEEFIADELMVKQNFAKSRINSYNRLRENVEKRGILAERNKTPELAMF